MNNEFKIGIEEINKFIELIGGVKIKFANPLIINAPTFNLEELQLGSLVYINKGYLQLQGFIADASPKVITLAYYDAESEHNKCSFETIVIEDVLNGEQTIEVIRKAIPLELQGV